MENLRPVYAGFWKRVLASIIDGLILSIPMTIIAIPINIFLGLSAAAASTDMQFDQNFQNFENNEDLAMLIAGAAFAIIIIMMISTVISWLYFALMESSSKQATLGKMALNLKVTDLAGNKIGFGRASGRYFSKFISSAIFCIGYVMVAFTEKKQALHDMIAGTLVTEK
jgi:uncharacterized RDD family membrane protein YckC